MDEATRLPVRTENRTPVAAPAQAMPFESLRREIDRIFDSFRLSTWDFPFRWALELELPWRRETSWGIAPPFEVTEKDEEYEITAVLPGMDEKNIEITLSNGTLAIRGEKHEENGENEKDYYLPERRYASFTRSFQVPEGVDTGKIEATFAKDVLTVKLPKTAKGWFAAIVIGALLVTGLMTYVY
jgi:HSP20 family protein